VEVRRLIWIAAAGLALLGAGIAIAHEGGSKSITKLGATTFTAATGSNVTTNTCSDGTNTFATTSGRWTGTASGDAALAGNVTIDAKAVINTTTGVGLMSGRMRFDATSGKHTNAEFDAVYSGGHIAGLAEGHGDDDSWNRLVANISADWSAATGFAKGQVGATTGGDAVLVTKGGCRAAKTKPEGFEAHGSLTLGASNATVTVAGVTCNVPATLSANVAKFHTGDQVEIKCTSSAGTNTLVRIESKGGHD
jgi:hypothetical protein